MRHHDSSDRRVRRTHGRLHEALASLIHQKPYDDIVVKEILARADVGRSTFYAHFRDKDELLECAIRDILDAGRGAASRGGRAERLLRFSLPLFEHIEQITAPAGDGARRQTTVHGRLRDLLAEQLEADLREGWPMRGDRPIPTALVARHVATTFVLVLEWWAEDGMRVSAREADAWFRALVLPGLVDLPSASAASSSPD